MGTAPPLLWGRCRSPDFLHSMWKPGEALCNKQMAETAQNAPFQWLKGIRVRERQLLLGHKALHLRMYVWEGTVLWAWRRWNSSKQDSNHKNADGSRMMGAAGTAGAASQHHCNGHWWWVSMAAGAVAELLQEKGQAWSQGDRRPSRTPGHTPVVADRLFPSFLSERLKINVNENTPGSQSITKPVPELHIPHHMEAHWRRMRLQCKNPRIRTPETCPGG